MSDKNHFGNILQESTVVEPVTSEEISDVSETPDCSQTCTQTETSLEDRFSRWVNSIDR